MKRILIGCNSAWSVLKFRAGLIRRLLDDGYEVVVAAPADACAQDLQQLGCRFVPVNFKPNGANPFEDLHMVLKLIRLLWLERPKVFITYTIKFNIYGAIAARIVRCNCVSVTTGLGYTFIQKGFVAWIGRLLFKIAYRFPFEIWFLNEDDRLEFVRNGLVEINKTKLIPGEGVNTNFFSTGSVSNHADSNMCVLLIARILWDKGVGEFVDAAAKLREKFPNAEFCLLGSLDSANPSAIPRFQVEKWQAEGKVRYLGVAEDVRPYIAAATCVVLPSYREGLPRCLLEAASMSLPIVATNVPGCRDVVDDGETGFLCRPADSLDLAEKISRVLAAPLSERMLMGEKGRSKVISQFDENLVVNCYMDLLRRLN